MIKKLVILLLISTLIQAQTVLKPNALEFSNGTGFTDTISEDLPINPIPKDITYEDYLNYIYGFTVYDLGTVNVSGGTATAVLFGKWVGSFEIPTDENYFAGIEGITDTGRRGSDGDANPIDYNAFSDIQVSKELNQESIWLRSNTNDINQIDAYKSIDVAFSPVSQMPLSLQAEGGNVNIQNKFYVKSSVTNRGNVGIGTTEPSEHLHVAGDIKANQLFGKVGKTVILDYYDVLTGSGNYPNDASPGVFNSSTKTFGKLLEGYGVNCYISSFSTAGWGAQMDALIFLSWYQWMQEGYNSRFLAFLLLYENSMTAANLVAQSAPSDFDFDGNSTIKTYTSMVGYRLKPDKTYYVKLIEQARTGANGDDTSHGLAVIYNISGFVYAVQN